MPSFNSFQYAVSFDRHVTAAAEASFSDLSGVDLAAPRLSERWPAPSLATEVVLKRGRMSAGGFFPWLTAARYGVAQSREVTITALDGADCPVASITLRNARPMKWSVPMLAAEGGDMAMEELVLANEGWEP